MLIVLDTSALLVSIPTNSPYRPIFDAILKGDIELALTTEILSEYIEKIEEKANAEVAANVAQTLLNLSNVLRTEVYYRWGLITQDYDDNKYADCAIAAGAEIIVSNDRHFNILKEIDFPKVEVMKIEAFLERLENRTEDGM